ncbi:uncharacterized protein LOC121855843 [Homarus americanus]|uniref:uncharacterized protein LOC121855843 n=1 Tax=Homarus americanus TaxID=6706 RepID=UPI001C471DC0|nr:uncharacterized protein LOC121855843 [Homarus americanus]XP_042206938.1 uncharacterized protein LOC121855843 [Homarus americanus]XP_042206939.1 uncharacterized protein LOC121855843 [Homarus americanus]
MKGFYILVTLVILVCGFVELTRALHVDDSKHSLLWAPFFLKSPYLTLINKFYHPSWNTRHPITKEETSLRYLKLPRGVPFAVACGACYQKSRISANLTISVTGHTYHSVPKRHSNNRQTEYQVLHNECLMTYMITAPLEKDGTITCTLNRGKQIKTEVISFSVVDVSVDDPPEELEIQNDMDEVTLHCPTPDEKPSLKNPHVYVWYEDISAYQSASYRVITKLRSIIAVPRQKHTSHIVCSAYSIVNPTKVYRTRYQILGSQSHAQQEYKVSNEFMNPDYDAQDLTPTMKLTSSVIGIIASAVIVCVLLLLVGIHHFITAATRK